MSVVFPQPVRLGSAASPASGITRVVPSVITRLLLQITEGNPPHIIPPGSAEFSPCLEIITGSFCNILAGLQEDAVTFQLTVSEVERHFRLEAFEAGQTVPIFVGEAHSIIRGPVTLTVQMQQGILILSRILAS